MPAEWTRPSWRGDTPTITKPTRAMMPVAASPASQTLSSRLCSSTVTATAEAISNQTRQNRRARMWATGWARIRFSARAAALQDRLFGVVPGKVVEGGLGRGQYGGEAEEDQRHAGQDQWGH